MRLDETGTDGVSPYTTVGGAVATLDQWGRLEWEWDNYLKLKKVSSFHLKEFPHHEDYTGWSVTKQDRFLRRLNEICKSHTLFRISVGVESSAHANIKERMKGIKGFSADSDYGLCLRYLMFLACKNVYEFITDNFELSILVEDGPYANGAKKVHSKVKRMTGGWKPVKFAHFLGEFEPAPKEKHRSLEAADYLVGMAHKRLCTGELLESEHPQVTILLDAILLERWYEGMIKEKEKRHAYNKNRKSSKP